MLNRLFQKLCSIVTKPDDEWINPDRYDDGVTILHKGEWVQGFNSEARQYIGKDEHGYRYALEISPAHDDRECLSWSQAYESREAAEECLGRAFDRWDSAMDDRWMKWEDRGIAAASRPSVSGSGVQTISPK